MSRHPESNAPDLPLGATPDPVTPGITIADGRYRLLEKVGGDQRVHATFWRARDGMLDRDVALATVTGTDGPRCVQAALAIGRLEHAGIARVLDVQGDPRQIGHGLTGLVVSEWVPGADLATLSTEATRSGRTLPTNVIARALSPLADAVDAAHRAGVALGIDHPQRVRVGHDGLARVAFPVVSASGRTTDDVRGLGAALYLTLTGRWPLPDPPAGLLAAPSSATGHALPPQSLRPAASPTLATLAERCLAGASPNGVHSGAAVHHLLDQLANAEADTMLLTPMPLAGSQSSWSDDDEGDEPPDRDRRRKLAIGVSVLAVAVLVLFGWVASQLVGFLSDDNPTGTPTLVVPKPSDAAQPSGSGQPQPQPTQPAQAGPIQAAEVQVFNLKGDPDNPNRANRVIDGNLESSWKTFDYNQPFPALKDGVGIIVSFVEPVTLAAVQIDSPSAGSTVEIRTAPSGEAGLAGSTVLGSGTLAAGRTEIQLQAGAPGQRVLVWITGLSTVSGKNSTELAELTFIRAG
ncbi:MAG TPA: protein kinase family protein [Pseudonocardiaceae bacterium]